MAESVSEKVSKEGGSFSEYNSPSPEARSAVHRLFGLPDNVVVDANNKPVGGANVMLYSEPKHSVTNSQGIASFDNVELGEHRALISYNGQEGEQKIEVDDGTDVDKVDFTVQIKPVSPFK